MLLVRCQCANYLDVDGVPLKQTLEFFRGQLWWKRVSTSAYACFSWTEVPEGGAVLSSRLRSLQSGLEYANDHNLIALGAASKLESPDLWGFHVFATQKGSSSISDLEHVDDLGGKYDVLIRSHVDLNDLMASYIAKERLDFLAAAERDVLGRNRLTDCVRLLEAAFSRAGDKLKKLLLPFLNTGPL